MMSAAGPDVDVVYGYVRVSSIKQEHGSGLEIQTAAVRKYCAENNLPPPTIVRETETGKNSERQQLNYIYEQARRNVADGNTPHCVLFKMDRLSRIMVHIDLFIGKAHDIGLLLHSCQPGEEQYFDPALANDPEIKMVRRILAAVIEHERDVIQIRLDSGLANLDAKGGYTGGTAPFGYRVVNKDLVIDEQFTPIVTDVVRLHNDGRTYQQIADAMEMRYPGIRKWSKQTIQGIVKRKRMYTEGVYIGRLGSETVRPELIIIKGKSA